MSKKKATLKKKITMNGKTSVVEVALFQPSGHQSYSGFGVHNKNTRKSERRSNRAEARNVSRGDW
ncbi:MAG: hypothetical protein EBU66_17680 [Bacteroidetes bacterium]|jgi:hypothetical protein|nr:hypothetical protein [bacterium]NBP66463.1 hypothetical protein [Bacteroidota bacterium]